ncbi:Por secretion system C-terminal sorting domain-containing protein [Candidatus Kryptonium thompsonii]|uniref:Por secretion system C-terminal sorting domain-containing protein n=1 Tax=Candidatus Kryptonium thompsonii TaxID=1633631 RepID=A0A0N7MQA1_9BACT|nr:S8 family serine peptidase [Candidatus Kryptonium thompsoni]CUS78453.1 Por secretion system C-terminal sorting domain-containing protein [Candidatus Kryptonium thompsoni]CUS81072.1 Por secretion system C-terminal sorting domain-containing protein [Candidatus Kryptonium thompsoni]CUS81171.1 Por secretion system C-terminal sorting domain-containing protein [Candidatus Kryptonium thompsoni]CUS81267.1 Por secretion system C-terminal sorting domain-containing protein [Candidatus Kryptonium thomps
MRIILLFLVCLFVILVTPVFYHSGNDFDLVGLTINKLYYQPNDEERLFIPGIAIVKFKPEYKHRLALNKVEIDEFTDISTKLGVSSVEKMFPTHDARFLKRGEPDLSLFYIVRFPEMMSVDFVVSKLSQLKSVEYAEPHYIYRPNFIPNDPYFETKQWYLRKVEIPLAWDLSQGDTNIVIGIADTGVDLDHPDLAGNIWRNWREIPGNGVDDDGNGYIDDFVGWDFGGKDNFNNQRSKQDNDPSEKKPVHGTHVAGIASAVTNNGIGVAGVGFKCKIMAVKVSIDDDSDNLIYYGYEGIVYAVDNGAKVINCSWGGGGGSRFEQEIINYATSKGALVVAAAGNSRSDEFHSPSGYKHVLSVASVDSNDIKAGYSNFGETVDVSAPGGVFVVDGGIFNTWYNDTYTTLTGTSMASPLVAGIAGLVRAKFPNLTPDQVAEKIRVTADPIDDKNPSYRYQLGYGRVNAYRALTVSSPAVRFEDFVIDDSLGNKDGAIDPGEVVQIRGIFKNYLEPASNLIARLETSDSYVQIINGTFTIGSLGTLQSKSNLDEPFKFQILPNTPENYTVKFVVKISSGSYSDFMYFKVFVRPTFREHNANFITLTITSRGNLAFNDYPHNTQGKGLTYRGGNNLLFEGAFMAGVSNSKIVDVARDETGQKQNRDFSGKTSFYLITPGEISAQDGFSIFTDSLAPTQNRIGIEVLLNSFAFDQTFDDMNFVLLKYSIVNKSGRDYQNFRAGLFLDFDLGSAYENVAAYDAVGDFVYVYDVDTAGEKTVTGIALVGGSEQGIWFINNAGDDLWGIYDGFTKDEKWEALSFKGVKRNSAGAGDVSVVISGGSQLLKNNDTLKLGFAIVCGDSVQVLRKAVLRARERWLQIITDSGSNNLIPDKFVLYQNYPNPFNIETNIKFALPKPASVTIEVFDLLGRKVKTLVQGERFEPGVRIVKFKADELPSGVYIYRVKAGEFQDSKKMVLIK